MVLARCDHVAVIVGHMLQVAGDAGRQRQRLGGLQGLRGVGHKARVERHAHVKAVPLQLLQGASGEV